MIHRISQLTYRYILGTITPDEQAELDRWIAEHPDNAKFFRSLTDAGQLDHDLKAARHIDTVRPAADMQRRLRVLGRGRRIRRRIAAAASIALLLATGLYLYLAPATSHHTPTLIAETASMPTTLDDIKHGSARARLTSSAGPAIELSVNDSGHDATSFTTLTPTASAATADTVQYCLDVPRGGEFKIVLEDSTEVWLNSQSQLRYPAMFADNERRIRLTGEAYLRVAHDADRPFYVESRGQEVRVYGTTFNIKAYDDEELIYTTLESGSVSLRPLSGNGGEIILSPGHQALFDRNNERVDMRVVKPSVITGWRNGRFVFEEQTLESIMRDLSRWYDFKYEFADARASDIVFLGSIPRYADFTTAIAILEKCGGVTFSLSDNKVLIRIRQTR